MVIAIGLGFSFLALIEAGLLLVCCGVGKKYTGHIFVAGLAILVVWFLGLTFHAYWLFDLINVYLLFLIGAQLTFAAIMGEVVNVLIRRWQQWRR